MAQIETYNEEINEFVDWVTGNDSTSETNVTDGKPVSGKSIRELLSKHLQDPIYLYLDTTDALYKIFSSQKAFNLWQTNKEKYDYLIKHTFEGPAQYTAKVELLGDSERYVKRSNNTTVPLQFRWHIEDTSGNQQPSTVQVKITIRNSDNVQTGSLPTYSYNSATFNANIADLYPYLNPGTNYVNIAVSSTENNATGSVTAIIYVIDMALTSDFNPFIARTAGSINNIVLTLTKSVSGSVVLYTYLDGLLVDQRDLLGTGTLTTDYSLIIPEQEGKHTLMFYTSMTNESGTYTIYSNLLYYDFVTSITDVSTDDRFLLIKHSFDIHDYSVIQAVLNNILSFHTNQYEEFRLDWGYYYANAGTALITWKLEYGSNEETLISTNTISNTQGTSISYIPQNEGSLHIVGYIGNVKSFEQPILIQKGVQVVETSGYDIKLNAYGKSNEVNKTWSYKEFDTSFNNVAFTSVNGWFENSLRLSGEDSFVTINFNPFTHKATDGSFTFEIEFYTEYINNNEDVLVDIGGMFKIFPNKACLYNSSGNEVIKTNFKSNEKIKLAFIVNGSDVASPDTNLAFIVNNGILERGASVAGAIFNNNSANIKIGGAKSGIRVYSIRHYSRAITYSQAYDNYVFDSLDKGFIVNNNNVLNQDGKIDSELCANKLDVIIIEGDITKLLDANTSKEDSQVNAKITRRCNYDTTKNFTITNGKIRKHGQSTLNYPIPSFKFWSNSSAEEGIVPEMEWAYNIGYNKNRYTMTNDSIPANKWILQANYADSSGVHNGGFQRLIQNTWYNSKINNEFKLRTPPQLFASKQTISFDDGSVNKVINGYNDQGQKITKYSAFTYNDFPYTIEIAPNSFPCVVFYKNINSEDQNYIFLGQYVFMEDKKSDYCYGERSMYNVPGDPFCLLIDSKGKDKAENRIWNNNNVLRMEVLEVDSDYSSYLTDEGFEDIIYDKDGNPMQYAFESTFEMIYPDPDDLEVDNTKYLPTSKFNAKVKPFIDWYKWLIKCKNGQEDFKATASQHLDLYKIAAYYIFCMRFGLVDSMERNAQIKTYDGIHFWYEPWDMDIALGNRNTGGIAFDPPIDRTTTEIGSTDKFALSGHNNYLWNSLEGWTEWINNIVPQVAQALYDVGLSYDNITSMFDDNYQNKWCEIIYNQSGHFKYVEQNSGNAGETSSFLAWLQGARTTHRHWWLKTSMDYWDAKWACGDFKNHTIYAATTKPAGKEAKVYITSSTTTYFNYALNYIMQELKEASAGEAIEYDITSKSISPKVPFNLYGTLYIKELDLSCLAAGLSVISLTGAYSDETGSNLINLNIGNKITDNKLTINNTQLNIIGLGGLTSLEKLDISGQHAIQATSFTSPVKLSELYAAGTNLSAFSSSTSGNNYSVLHLPETVSTFSVTDSSWEELKFFHLTQGNKIEEQVDVEQEDGSTITEIHTKYEDSTLSELSNISNILKLDLKGTTGQQACSKELVYKWIDSIKDIEDTSAYSINVDNIYWTGVTYEEVQKLAPIFNKEGNVLKGYIRLSNDENLTNDQLLQLVAWFGDSVFMLNGGGITIDYPLNMEQVVLGTPVYTQNNEFYVQENKIVNVRLRYVKFSLQEMDDDTSWSIIGQGATQYSDKYKSCEIICEESAFDNSKKWYLRVKEGGYGDYDVTIKVDIDGQSYNEIIHIKSVVYPKSISITHKEMENCIISDDAYIFQRINSRAIFKPVYDTEYTATVDQIAWALTDVNSGIKVEDDLYVNTQETHPNIQVLCKFLDDTVLNYKLTLTVVYMSGIRQSTNIKIKMQDDTELVNSNTAYLFSVFQKANPDITTYYKSNVESIKELDFSGDNGDQFSLIALNGQSILNYLTNIETITFEGNPSIINDSSQPRFNLDYTKLYNAKNLNVKDCINLHGEIDISELNVENLNTEGTDVNIVSNESQNIQSILYGNPQYIDLNSNTNLSTLEGSAQKLNKIHLIKNDNIGQFKLLTDIIDYQNGIPSYVDVDKNVASTKLNNNIINIASNANELFDKWNIVVNNFNGTYEIFDNYINMHPDDSDVGANVSITVINKLENNISSTIDIKCVNYYNNMILDGNSYFDTGYVWKFDTKIVTESIATRQNQTYMVLWGGETASNSSKGTYITFMNTGWIYSSNWNITQHIINEKYTLERAYNYVKVNDILFYAPGSINASTSPNTIYLGALHRGNAIADSKFVGSISYMKIYEANILVHEFRPYNTNQMIDVVTGNIINNSGSGTANVE